MNTHPTLIIGGGIVGLSIGWELARQGKAVSLFEREETGRATSWLAAGMLAAGAEIGFEEPDLYRLTVESLRRWPEFAADLEAASGRNVDLRTEGTLLVADDRDAAEALRRRYEFMREQKLGVQWLTATEALEREPFVAPRLAGAVFSPGDYQVDNRLVVDALKEAYLRRGGVLHEHTTVDAIEPHAEVPAVRTRADERFEGSCVVVAAGAWSRDIGGLGSSQNPPIRPVKGQMIELKMAPPFGLKHVVRGPGAYLAPKSSGRILIGATSEEMGFDRTVTAGGIYTLLEEAWKIVPGIYDLPVTDLWAGLRPASRDHLPVLGPTGAPGVVMATGLFRHGVLLAPVAAQEVARLILSRETSDWIRPFLPARFATR